MWRGKGEMCGRGRVCFPDGNPEPGTERTKGELFLYVFHLDQPDKSGEYIPTGITLQRKRWYRLTQRIVVNTDDNADGSAEVWVNGQKVLDRRNFCVRTGDQAPVDKFYFSTFFGGGNADWAPIRDVSVRFDSFTIAPSLNDPISVATGLDDISMLCGQELGLLGAIAKQSVNEAKNYFRTYIRVYVPPSDSAKAIEAGQRD